MGYELLVLVVKFGLNSEILEFLWKMTMVMKTWLVDDMNPCLMCFNWPLYLCYLLMKFVQQFCVNWDQNLDFGVFLVWVPEREPIFWVPCSCLARPASHHVSWRDVHNSTRCYAHSRILGLFPNIPKYSFCGVLMLFWLI